VRRLLGTALPYIGRVVIPCDENGVPFSRANIDACQFETKAIVLAWLGGCCEFGYGPVSPRRAQDRYRKPAAEPLSPPSQEA
jgi:hypothetical protein